ncbi:hypothetical protein ACFPVT_01460 [Corynebacterium choanae]|uniref:Secreted protein n=1 Tax=Corynebacterium choanae TaxID=1862358 RepID=A0A3G6J3D4_9CORY|nr:hypothetical protein [Corynebacterium choanae]AZA12527.1 hypothetical protein CCHOA_00490 [Corynebacterium choanae]
MRKIRNAAIVGLTAVSLVAGGINVASAEVPTCGYEFYLPSAQPTDAEDVDLADSYCETREFDRDLQDYLKNPADSSPFGARYNATKEVRGVDLLGLHKNFSQQPVWSQIWYVVTVLGVIGTVIGIGALPVLNTLKAQGVII